jgi:hypothetical protein
MSRRFTCALTFAALAAATAVHAAPASDRACSRDGVAHLVPAVDELSALFTNAAATRVVSDTENATTAPMGATEVLMARIGTDGKVVIACVDTEAAARRFLAAPVEAIGKVKEK